MLISFQLHRLDRYIGAHARRHQVARAGGGRPDRLGHRGGAGAALLAALGQPPPGQARSGDRREAGPAGRARDPADRGGPAARRPRRGDPRPAGRSRHRARRTRGAAPGPGAAGGDRAAGGGADAARRPCGRRGDLPLPGRRGRGWYPHPPAAGRADLPGDHRRRPRPGLLPGRHLDRRVRALPDPPARHVRAGRLPAAHRLHGRRLRRRPVPGRGRARGDHAAPAGAGGRAPPRGAGRAAARLDPARDGGELRRATRPARHRRPARRPGRRRVPALIAPDRPAWTVTAVGPPGARRRGWPGAVSRPRSGGRAAAAVCQAGPVSTAGAPVVLPALAGVALLVWVWLALFRGLFWRTDQRLPAGAEIERWPSVGIVVPARDEGEVLPLPLPTLLGQQYPGSARVVLVDDDSTDGTGALARRLAYPGGLRLTVVEPGKPPDGWTGKVWALRAGVAEAGEVDLVLLTDADIAHRPDSLAILVRAAAANRLDLLSQLARLRVQTGWERLVVPAFGYFFALLYPFRWVNRPGARTAAAAGGCVLVRRLVLERAGGLAAIRGAVIDDVALARVVKHAGGRVFLGLADRLGSLRPYPTLGSLWQMVSRSAYAQLRYSPFLLAGTVAGLALVFAVPPATAVAGAATGSMLTLALGAAGWLLMAGTYLPTLSYHRVSRPAALLLPFTAALYLAMTVDAAVRHYRHGGPTWKGRTYLA